MTFKRITIVGLGLMGGSLAAACREKFPKARITGVSRNPQAVRTALRKKWIHEGTREFRAAARNADLIILCTPVSTFKDYFCKIEASARPGTCVTDVGSTKGEIQAWADRQKFKNFHYIGAHPMAGSHHRGIASAKEGLYAHGFTFIVPPSHGRTPAFRAVKAFWQKISPKTVEISASGHDRVVSEISHLPHAVAVSLVLAVSESSLCHAATGFTDTTRIAAGHPSIWIPIFQENRKNLLTAITRFEKKVAEVKKSVQKNDTAALSRLLNAASGRRQRLSCGHRGKV